MPQANLNFASQELGHGRVWITNSKTRAGLIHVTLFTDAGQWHCTCEAYRFRYSCRHVNDLKDELNEDNPDFEVNL
jgi:hypothetical protein